MSSHQLNLMEPDGQTNKDAVWFYEKPLDGAEIVKERVAFWKGVKVVE
jgi:uncharacterized protein (DUF427 family)